MNHPSGPFSPRPRLAFVRALRASRLGSRLLPLALGAVALFGLEPLPAADWLFIPGTNNWNTDANWNPANAPSSISEVAVFNTSMQLGPTITAFTDVTNITFNPGASSFTIHLNNSLNIGQASPGATGVLNLSGVTQTFVVDVALFGVSFFSNTSAGNAIYNNVATQSSTFFQSSAGTTPTAGNAGINNLGASSKAVFVGGTAANATITNIGALSSVTFGTGLGGEATAGNAIILNNGSGSDVDFTGDTTAGNAIISNGGLGSSTQFDGTSGAGTATIINVAGMGVTNFRVNSSAENATITNNSNVGGFTQFINNATAGSATITNDGNGLTRFFNTSNAGSANITNAGAGSLTLFDGSGAGVSASTATITNSGANSLIHFRNVSTGGSAALINANATAVVDISEITAAGMTAGSISGNGFFRLGSKTLTLIGSGSGTVTGVIQDGGIGGGVGGKFERAGTGTTTLASANTYTGGTTLNAGTLFANNNTALGTGPLTINGGTLGSTTGATLANDITANADVSIALPATNVQPGLTLNGKFDLGGGAPRTVTITSFGGTVKFGGQILNGAGLTLTQAMNGSGEYEMTGAVSNTYTGLTTISGTLVSLTKPAGFIAIPGNLSLINATVGFYNNNANPIGGTTITIDNGLLQAATPVNLPQAIVLNGRASFAGSGDSRLTGAISGPGSFRVVNSFGGTVSLTNNASTYSGGTELESGTLFADANNALGTGPLSITTANAVLASHFNNIVLPNNLSVESDFSIAPPVGALVVMTLAGNVALTGPARTITHLTEFAGVVFSGAIGGASDLTLVAAPAGGLRNFTFGGATANTYTGTTTVEDRIFLNLNKTVLNGAIPGDLVINPGAVVSLSLDNQIADTSTVTNNSNGSAAVNFAGFDLNGRNETIGSLFGDGLVQLNNGKLTGAGATTAGILTVGAGDFSGIISDAGFGGQLVKETPGTLFLHGANTYIGNTTINNGSLLVIGSIASANTFVNPLGLLGGTGVIGGNVFNHGIVSPGLSPGKLTITGNYTQFADGTLRIEVAGTQPGQFDQLVVGGSASLAGRLQLIRIGNFEFERGDRLEILTAAGGVNGKFKTVEGREAFQQTGRILTLEVIYEPNAVVLELVQGSFADFARLFGLTRNQTSVAKALDQIVFDQRAEKLVAFLNSRPLAEIPKDLDLIAPEELASMYEIGFSLATVQNINLQRRMDDIRTGSNGFSAQGFALGGSEQGDSDGFEFAGPVGAESKGLVYQPAPENRWGVFVTGLGEIVNVDGTKNAPGGYDLSTGGLTLGVDYRVRPGFAIGFNAGYARTYADLVNDGRVTVDGGKLGLYATAWCPSGFYVDAAVGAGLNSYETQRRGLQGRVRGDADGTEINALLGTGFDWKKGALTIGPTASFQYTYLDIDGFRERGSLAPLDIEGKSTESVRSTIGFRTSYDGKLRNGIVIKPELRAAWQHEYGDREYAIGARFANGAGKTFTVDGPRIDRDSLLLGAGVAVQFSERLSTYLYYDAQVARTNYNSHSLSAGVRLAF